MQRILIIEDEQVLCENIKSALLMNNYEVHTASNGKAGFETAEDLKPDLILCDIMMPIYDGYWVLEKVRSNKTLATTPFIFITAKVERDDLRKGMELGADDYLTKPFKIAELLKAIDARLLRNTALKKSSFDNNDKSTKLDIDKFILLDTGKSIEKILVSTIVCILAEDVYTNIFLNDKTNVSVRKSLATWESLLPENSFVRIHRSAIINLLQVKQIEKWFNQTMRVHMVNFDQPITISRSYTSLLKDKLIL